MNHIAPCYVFEFIGNSLQKFNIAKLFEYSCCRGQQKRGADSTNFDFFLSPRLTSISVVHIR